MQDRIERGLDWLNAKMSGIQGKEWQEMNRAEKVVTDIIVLTMMSIVSVITYGIGELLAPLFQ